MAQSGSLHVTVIAATLLRDSGGSDSDHRAKPAWNESHTFKFDERSDDQSQHILIEIFAEKPRLDELLGLAKIPLHSVIKAGDEISTHALNRPHEEYTSREKYSGHVKVAMKWDSAQRPTATAYPQAYTPAARYNPNGSLARVHAFPGQTTTGRSEEKLQSSKSCEVQQLAGEDRRVHQRSSSCPSGHRNFSPSTPSPLSQSLSTPPLKKDKIPRPQQHPSNVQSTAANQSSRSTSGHARSQSSFEAPSDALQQQEHGHGAGRNVAHASPHIPYVSQEGMTAGRGIANNGLAVHGAVVKPPESGLADSHLKMSRSKQAEMMKLAELSRLTQIATTEATGFAKAGLQHPSAKPNQADLQGQISSRPKANNAQLLTQLSSIPERQRNNAPRVRQQVQAPLQQLSDSPHWPIPQSKALSVIPNRLDIVSVEPQKLQKPEARRKQPDTIYEKAILKSENPDQKKKLSSFRHALKILRKTTSKIFGQ